MSHHDHTASGQYSPPPPPKIPKYLEKPTNATNQQSRRSKRPPKPKRNPLLIPLISVSLIALVMSVLYAQTFSSWFAPNTSFADAAEACEISENSDYIEVADEGYTLLMTSEGDESPGASIVEIACVFVELEMPSSIVNRFDTTRALDGTQTGTWDKYEATWNYHPDSGSNITITIVDP